MIKLKLFGLVEAKPTPAAANIESPGTRATGTASSKRVLVVDGDAVFLAATAMKLRAAGFAVVTARESSEALAAVNDQPIDAVLIDIDLPVDVSSGGIGWNGFQLMHWMRGLQAVRGARFMIATHSDSPADRHHARQLGVLDYFNKPVNYDQLCAAIARN